MSNFSIPASRLRIRIWIGDAWGYPTGTWQLDETVTGDDRLTAAARHAQRLATIDQPFVMLVNNPESPEPPHVRSNSTDHAEQVLSEMYDPETGQTLKLDPEVYRKQAGL